MKALKKEIRDLAEKYSTVIKGFEVAIA